MEITKFDIMQLILDRYVLSEEVYRNEIVPILKLVYGTKDKELLSKYYYEIYNIYENCKR